MNADEFTYHTPRLILRPHRVADAPILKEAIDSNLDHLRPWMAWAWREPTPLPKLAQRIKLFRSLVEAGEDWPVGIWRRPAPGAPTRLVGSAGIHRRDDDETLLEIGYWLRADETGRGYVTEAAAALTQIAFRELGAARVEIRCDPANVPSYKVAERLGYRHTRTIPDEQDAPGGGRRDTMVWLLTAAELPQSPASRVTVQRAAAGEV